MAEDIYLKEIIFYKIFIYLYYLIKLLINDKKIFIILIIN